MSLTQNHMLSPATMSPDPLCVNQETSPSLCSLLLLNSACGHNRRDTRVLMNLISLICLCLLSPKRLLLFIGVLQSYLISPLVVSQHAASLWLYWQHGIPTTWCTYSATCGRQKARCVSVICVIKQRIDLDRNTVSADISAFSPPYIQPMTVSLPPHWTLFKIFSQ